MSPEIEITVRLSAYAGVFLLLALWELFAPRRDRPLGRWPRWPGNLGILVVDTLAVRLLIPVAAVGVAVYASERGIGLLHLTGWPGWLKGLAGFVLLDLVIYAQHVAFHRVPVLWRLHRMHHADLDIDLTTGVRFHPFEILLSLGIKIAVVLAFGIPPLAVLVFEVVLNATSMFNHANVWVPPRLEPLLRWIVVTPRMHQVHHSIVRAETDSNFGFNLPWWDRLFGTYRPRPMAPEQTMTIGLPVFRDPRELALWRMLLQPFRRAGDGERPTPAQPERAEPSAS